MPQGFTTDEVRTVAERLVRTSLRRPHDVLGTRRTDVTYGDLREAAASVFLTQPKAPYAVAELARQRLLERLNELDALTAETITIAEVLKRRAVPVRDLSSLSNAKAALQELEGAVRQRAPKDIRSIPAYVRFDANLRRFLDKAGQNVRSQGAIVPTAIEARARLASLPGELKTLVLALVDDALRLGRALEDYGNVGLAELVAGNVIASARTLLDARTDDLEARSEPSRLEVLKQTVLELLAVRAVVRGFGSFTPAAASYSLEGTGSLFADVARPMTPGALVADKKGPFVLLPGTTADDSTNVLRCWLDGSSPPASPTATIYLPASVQPTLQGTVSGPFTIVAGVNDELWIRVAGVDYMASFPDGSISAQTIAAALTVDLFGSGFKGEAYFAPLFFDGEVVVAGNVLTQVVGTFTPNSVHVGDEVDFYLGANAGVTRTVTAVTPSEANPVSITVSGGALTAGPDQRARYGSANRKVRIVPTNPATAVAGRVRIDLVPPNDAAKQAGLTLGLFGNLFSEGSPTDASVVATVLNQLGYGIRAESFTAVPSRRTFRTDPLNGTRLVAYDYRGAAAWVAGTSSVVTFASDHNLVPGAKLVLREGMNPNAVGTVTTLLDVRTAVVTFLSPVVAGSGAVEAGSLVFTLDTLIEVVSGPYAGEYHPKVLDVAIPFQCQLREFLSPFRNPADGGPFLFEGVVGEQGIRFLSRRQDLTGSVRIEDPLGVFFDNPSGNVATAETRYLKLPKAVAEEGDTFEYYGTNYEVPDLERLVVNVFGDAVVELDATLVVPLFPLFGEGLPPPFARLRSGSVSSYDDFSRRLLAWAAAWEGTGTTLFFKDLQRFVNPLRANENPTDSDVGSFVARINVLRAAFLGPAEGSLGAELLTYTGPERAEVKTLFQSLREKGADRAVDLLLGCQFQAFFGLTEEGASYAGAMQAAVRDVAQMDLPIHKDNRASSTVSQLQVSAESPDFEYDSSDLDDTRIPDPTIDFS